ncbi:MAG: hypothetical protein ACYTEQ_06460 [Planctomycetota bacterium]|jgi:hypothetical protein
MTELRYLTLEAIDPLSGLLDAFGRQRVSEPQTVFDSHQIFDDGDLGALVENFPQYWDNQETSGSGTTTIFNVNRASTTLRVGATTAGTRTRQSKRRLNYQPGKSQRALLTFVFGAAGTGITREIGLFDDNDGLLLRQTPSNLQFVRRSNATGTPADTVVNQSAWDIDPLNGTGPSGITLDITKAQILIIDFEWLGVGTARFGFVIDGMIYYAHSFDHSNIIANVYMSTPNLPVRAQIDNDGTGAQSNLEHICSEVSSEGGIEPQGVSRAWDNDATAVTGAAVGTRYALLGVRLRSSHLGLEVDFTQMSVMLTSANDTAHWELHLNPTLSAALSYGNISLSGLQGAVGTGQTITTAGEIILSGYVKTSDSTQIPADVAQKLGSLIDGTPDELVLSMTPLQVNTDAVAALNWRELL